MWCSLYPFSPILELKQAQCELALSVRDCPVSANTKFTLPDAAATDDEIRIQSSMSLFHDILIENGEAIDRLVSVFKNTLVGRVHCAL